VLPATNGALASTAAMAVTKQQIVALAHAIYAHLG
jgi:hypothetical protein